MNEPLVSVLMTAYNREKYIAEAIESVLASTYKNFELIIVDDCSKDKTVEIGKSYELRDKRIRVYVNEKNLGDYPNRNKAAKYASGEYLKYVDSDDLIYPFSLEIMVRAMQKFPEAAVGITSRISQDKKPYPFLMQPSETYKSHFFVDGCLDVGPLALIIKKSSFFEYGGFSGRQYVGDTELLLGMARKWPIVKLQSSLVFWRIHDEQQIKYEAKTTIRLEATLPITERNLLAEDCPLDAKKAEVIIKRIRKKTVISLLKYSIKTMAFRHSYKIFRNLKLKSTDLF